MTDYLNYVGVAPNKAQIKKVVEQHLGGYKVVKAGDQERLHVIRMQTSNPVLPIEAIYRLFDSHPKLQSKMPTIFTLLQFQVPALRQYKPTWTSTITARFNNDLSIPIKDSECLTLAPHLKQLKSVCQSLLDNPKGNANFIARNIDLLNGLKAVSAIEMAGSTIVAVDQVRLKEIVEVVGVVSPVKGSSVVSPQARL